MNEGEKAFEYLRKYVGISLNLANSFRDNQRYIKSLKQHTGDLLNRAITVWTIYYPSIVPEINQLRSRTNRGFESILGGQK